MMCFSILRRFSDSVLPVSFQGTEEKTWGTQRRSWLVLQPRHLAYPPQHFRRLLGRHLRYPVESRHFFTCTSRFYHVICLWHSWDSRNWICRNLCLSLSQWFSVTFGWFCVMGVVFEWFLMNDFWMSMYVWWNGVRTIFPAFWLSFEWFVWWSGFWMIFECYILWFQNDCSTIFAWFCVTKMVPRDDCDEMIFDDLVRFWTDFVWWKWFWNGFGWLRNDFWMLLCVGKGWNDFRIVF